MPFGSMEDILEQDAHADEFEGEITIDETVEGRDGQEQWHFGVTPKGSDKTPQVWLNPGKRVAEHAGPMVKCGVKGKKPGDGELLGIHGIFTIKHRSFTGKDGRDYETKTILMVKYLGEGQPKAAYDSDDIVTMMTFLTGKPKADWQKGVMKEPLLSNAAKLGILDGSAITFLTEGGYAVEAEGELNPTAKAIWLAQR